MPIPREFRHFYLTPAYLEAKRLVRLRSGGLCEECKKPLGQWIRTRTSRIDRDPIEEPPRMIWRPHDSLTWRNESGWPVKAEEFDEILEKVGPIRDLKVQLHCAHLNHVPGDDRLENLRYWCNWHHFMHDRPHHELTRSIRKDRGRPLLVEASA